MRKHTKKVPFMGLLCIAGTWLLMPSSCGLFSRLFPGELSFEPAAAEARDRFREPEPPVPFPPEGGAQRREALLLRGNSLVAGIPGFGENAFPAVYGEYSLSLPGASGAGAAGETPGFAVWVSRERLYLPNPPWIPRPGIPGCRVMEQGPAGSMILAVTGEEAAAATAGIGPAAGPGAIGTLVFRIPLTAADALGAGGLNRLIGVWVSRFAYFLHASAGSGALSLPAVLNF